MALFKTSNPALTSSTFDQRTLTAGEGMTASGAVNKTGILVILAVLTAAWSWNQFAHAPESVMPLLAIGGIGGFVAALVTIFKKEWSPITAPLYALLE